MPRFSFVKKFFLGVGFSLIFCALQASAYSQQTISNGINHYLADINPSIPVGVVVQSMQTGQTLYSKNANHFFEPASVQKLFTVSSALLSLKPSYHFQTKLLSTGNVSEGVLHGNLVFQFSGDPTLTQKDIAEMVAKLKSIGVNDIAGNIIIDNTAYNHVPYPAGWVWSDLSLDFAAPLDTVIINRNQFGVTFVPGRRVGEKPIIIPNLPEGSATFYNEMTTTRYPGRNCPITIFSNEHNQYVVRGCLPQSAGKEYRSLAIRNMEMFARGLIRELLHKNNIQFHGKIFSEKTPANTQLLDDHASASLSHVIIHLLKTSDNLYADTLLKKMGERYANGNGGSWQDGLNAMHTILANEVGVDLNELHLIDGAGLSRFNLITPNAISTLLHYIDRNEMLNGTLIPALPIAGVDGTLAWRMPNLARGHRVHAKTGSMTGVSTLAGFVKTAHSGVMSFVIMVNNVPKNRWQCLLMENHIVELLARS